MTKRRKLYKEKRKDAKRRASDAIQAVMRGVPPDDAIKYFRIFDHYALSMIRTLYIPKKPNWKERYAAFDKMISDDMRIWNLWKKKSWIEKAKEKFLSKLNSDVEKQYIKDIK